MFGAVGTGAGSVASGDLEMTTGGAATGTSGALKIGTGDSAMESGALDLTTGASSTGAPAKDGVSPRCRRRGLGKRRRGADGAGAGAIGAAVGSA